MKNIAIFLVGCIVGALFMGALRAIRQGADDLQSWDWTDVRSDTEVRQAIKDSNIALPAASWDLFYAINGFQDHAVWIAFTVPQDQVWSVVAASMHKERGDFTPGIPEEFLDQVEMGMDQGADTTLWAPKQIKNPLHHSIRRGSSYFEDWVLDEDDGRIFITKQTL